MKASKATFREVRRGLVVEALPSVRALVKKYDSTVIMNCLKVILEERKAQKELIAAEKKVAELKKKLG